ncbi:vicilin-like antimicrobial peptides 2-1 [Telopea speciosissima]|uniref:vicilin-like antimicrobial peptides 2-1 n=1 Tax=Telopea speciosissima TaxID=54955 RepID=UPI001CC53A0E|nr:vicilin-like antimicrobial peptides 2-1 [Telopea speciosissima]
MVINTKLCFLLFLLSFFFLSTTLSLAEGELDKEDQDQDNRRDLQRQYQECQQRCQRQDPRQQHQCQRRCQEQSERGRGGDLLNSHRRDPRGYEEEEEEEEQRDNPYYFDERSFTTKFRTEEGHVSLLESFSRRSELLRALENYCLELVEANPNAFVLPKHLDAEAIFLVVQGRGVINMVRHHNKESYTVNYGDVIRVPAGTTFYLVNRDNNERLRIAKFLFTESTPGHFREYFPAGAQNPESYLRTFSKEILQAALNTRTERIHKVLGQQREGVIIRATHDQIKELTRHASGSESRHWPIGRGSGHESRGPYNLFNRKSHISYSNNYGQSYEVRPEDYRELQNMDVSVCITNISQGSMMGPFFNTKSTKVVVVDSGEGYVEMACPHLSRRRGGRGGRHEEEEDVHYQLIRSRLSPRSTIVVPAGHPVVFVAFGNENLQLFAFGINAQDNHENFLAGKERNVLQQIESQALELAFAAPRKEVEQLLNSQDESVFFPGPRQQQHQSKDSTTKQALPSILDFVGF